MFTNWQEFVKVWRESSDVKLPEYMSDDAACMDVYIHSIEYNKDIVIIHTGLHFEVPKGFEMQIRPRSGFTKYRYVMINTPGTLDADYRGELLLKFTRIDGGFADDFPLKVGDRCGQINIHRIPTIIFREVDKYEELTPTKRGDGGFGHSGK